MATKSHEPPRKMGIPIDAVTHGPTQAPVLKDEDSSYIGVMLQVPRGRTSCFMAFAFAGFNIFKWAQINFPDSGAIEGDPYGTYRLTLLLESLAKSSPAAPKPSALSGPTAQDVFTAWRVRLCSCRKEMSVDMVARNLHHGSSPR